MIRMPNTLPSRVVFVGGGHAHLFCLKYAQLLVSNGAHVVLIGPDVYHYYSGMGPGMLSGIYSLAQVRFNVAKLIQSRGGEFIEAEVKTVDAGAKVLGLSNGQSIRYDIVSFNVGSYIPPDLIRGAENIAYPVKPIETMLVLQKEILQRLAGDEFRILLVGACPAGVELAGNIWRLIQHNSGRVQIVLAGSESRILPRTPEKAGVLARQSLASRGIRVLENCRVDSIQNGIARTETGHEIAFDLAVLSVGIRPRNVFGGSGLNVADDGALLVDDFLQSTSHKGVFGGGDCIDLAGRHLDRVGVHAVRQGPVLFHNIQAYMQGKKLKRFKPQKQYMLIFNLGDGNGIFVRGSLVIKGRFALRLKDFIDRRFMARFQVSGELTGEIS